MRVLADHSGPTRWGTPLHSGSNRLRLTLNGDSRAGSYGGARLNTLFLSITGQPATSVRCVQPCPTSAATPSAAVSLRLRRPLPAFRSTPPALRPIVARRQTGGHSHAVRVLRRSPGYRPALCSGPAVTAPPRARANPSRPGTTAAPCRPECHPWPERPASLPGCRPVPLQRCARSRPTPALHRCGVRFQSGPGGQRRWHSAQRVGLIRARSTGRLVGALGCVFGAGCRPGPSLQLPPSLCRHCVRRSTRWPVNQTQQSCSRSGLPQRQVRGIQSAVGLRQILGLLVTPAGTRQRVWAAREYAAFRKSRCPPGRSAASIRPAPPRTDDAARPAGARPVRKTPCSPTPSLPGIQSGRRRTDRVAPQRSTARARKPWRRAVATALFRDSLHSR